MTLIKENYSSITIKSLFKSSFIHILITRVSPHSLISTSLPPTHCASFYYSLLLAGLIPVAWLAIEWTERASEITSFFRGGTHKKSFFSILSPSTLSTLRKFSITFTFFSVALFLSLFNFQQFSPFLWCCRNIFHHNFPAWRYLRFPSNSTSTHARGKQWASWKLWEISDFQAHFHFPLMGLNCGGGKDGERARNLRLKSHTLDNMRGSLGPDAG